MLASMFAGIDAMTKLLAKYVNMPVQKYCVSDWYWLYGATVDNEELDDAVIVEFEYRLVDLLCTKPNIKSLSHPGIFYYQAYLAASILGR